jgi:DNA-binding LacI/PurR family transcriptional regulator/DNA-binding transcriptional regulator YhcF (GntR family)
MNQWQRLSTIDQFTAHLRVGLLSGQWTDTMPGGHRLAAEFGLNGKTVEAALQRLEKEGLLVGQGAGRSRKIVLSENNTPPALRMAVLNFEFASRGEDFMIELRHLLEKAGHTPFYTDKTLVELDMNVGRIARHVKKTEADAWVSFSASQEVLEWFAEQETPAFALFGVMEELPLAGTKPDKIPPLIDAIRQLLSHGHRRISILCRRQHRLPQPAKWLRASLNELEAASITTGAFNIPDWEESPQGFVRLLESLFGGPTPPTALILDEAILYHAAYHHLAQRGLRVPDDVSLVCTDADLDFAWCQPSVAHIRWDYRPVLRRVVRWANNVAKGNDDRRQRFTKAEFVEGGTVGPVAGN